MERHDIKPDWTVHNGGFGGKPEPETVVTEPESTEPEKEAEKPVSRGK